MITLNRWIVEVFKYGNAPVVRTHIACIHSRRQGYTHGMLLYSTG
jgi:hypothetical protein